MATTQKKLQIGERFPDFSLPNENNETVNLTDYIGQPLVIYFYPKDDTPGCTMEACTFRDQFEDFQEAGVTVFGVSSDTVDSHQKFKARHRLPFSLLSDKGGKLRKQLGMKSSLFGLLPGRVTFVLDKEGCLVHEFTSQFDAKKHVSEALNVIKTMK